MSAPSPAAIPLPSSRGGLTAVILFLVTLTCIALIGASGYVKYQLDRAESAMLSPESQLTPDQQAFDKIRRDLGYGGYLGLAQNFAVTHDAAVLPDMKAQLKQAQESFAKLPEKTPADIRHDLQTILAAFTAATEKAERSTAAPPTPDFTGADLTPLYASLPILDARLTSLLALNRATQQAEAQFWATLLTLISWASLVIAAGLAAGIWLVLRDRNSAPMRALAQSVKNMARGDMRTAVWGMERQDAIGELARSIDMARFHFSQLPDMSLLSEQGPVRIRFEGNTRSLFEAMMRVISRDSETVHEQANALTEAVQKQSEGLALVIERVEAVLQNVEKRAMSGDVQVRQALQGMLSSAESLKNAQEHAADQLNRIIPFMQERSQGLSEIAHITGKQVSSVLQSLTLTERGLKSSSEQSELAIRKFSSTADTLGERMFGAVNLLQASGKVLAETSENTQSRLEQAIVRIGSLSVPTVSAATPSPQDDRATQRLEAAVAALEAAHGRLENLLAEQTEATRTHIDLLTTQSGGLLTQAATTAQTLSSAADHLRDEQAKLAAMLEGMTGKMDSPASPPAAPDHPSLSILTERIQGLGGQITAALALLGTLPQQVAAQMAPEPAFAASLMGEIKTGFESITQNLSVLHAVVAAQQSNKPADAPSDLSEQIREQWFQMAGQIEATRSNLAQVIMQQTDRVEMHLNKLTTNPAKGSGDATQRDTQNQMEQQTLILNELVATLGLLDAHMQELRTQVSETQQRAG